MPPELDLIQRVFREHGYTLTAHASDRAVRRGIAGHDIEEAVLAGEVIEDYPQDKYGPSCLILGQTAVGRILHVQASYPPGIKVITVYEPSPDDWEHDWKTRKG
ncbi:MAG: DUF4258 domain-containing protein [Anaerolineae bacterium]|nr:DUF4258 domain-containing protein [Anaerolineae bacterium]